MTLGIEKKHRKARATQTLANIAFIACVLGCVFIVADQPIVETVDALIVTLGIIGASLLVGALVGYYLGRDHAEDQGDYYDALALGYDAFSAGLFTKWLNWQNQTNSMIINQGNTLDTQYLFYGRLAENKVPSYVGEPWGDAVIYNLTHDLMADTTMFLRINSEDQENAFLEMVQKANAMNLDVPNHHTIRDTQNSNPTSTNMGNGNVSLHNAFWTGATNDTYFTSKLLVYPVSTTVSAEIWVKNLTSGEDEVLTVPFNALTRYTEFEYNGYPIQVEAISGDAFIYGLEESLTSSSSTHLMREFTREYYFDDHTDWIQDEKSLVGFGEIYYPSDNKAPISEYVQKLSLLRTAVVNKAQIRYNTYHALGYWNTTDIPEDEFILPVDVLFWDQNQMDDMDTTQLTAMWFSFLDWVNRSSPDYEDTLDVSVYDFNFTNADLVARINLTKWDTEYDGNEDIISSTPTVMFTNRLMIIIPLEETLNLTVGDSENLTQNVMMFDIGTFEFFTLTVPVGNRTWDNVTDYQYDILGLTHDEIPINSGEYIITTGGDWAETEFGITPAFATPSDVPVAATTYIYIALAAVGGGIAIMVISGMQPQLAALKPVGWLMLIGGIIAALGLYVWYYLWPSISDWFGGIWPL